MTYLMGDPNKKELIFWKYKYCPNKEMVKQNKKQQQKMRQDFTRYLSLIPVRKWRVGYMIYNIYIWNTQERGMLKGEW